MELEVQEREEKDEVEHEVGHEVGEVLELLAGEVLGGPEEGVLELLELLELGGNLEVKGS